MSSKIPTIFISSTFFDLQQIRLDLCSFIENDLGYSYLASEFSSFPIDPEESTIENCKRRLYNDADIFILIVGGRYGSIDKNTNKSVTNLEYLAARSKGIMSYIFISKEILSLMPMWEANPNADYSKVVDNPQLFEFIKKIRNEDSVWSFPFESSQDIIKTLKMQFAYQMQNGIKLLIKLQKHEESYEYLSGKALRIVLEKLPGWEGFLLAQCVNDEINDKHDMRLAYDAGIAFGAGQIIESNQVLEWISSRIGEAQRIIDGLKTLISNSVNVALETRDIGLISYCGREIGNAYKSAIDWASNIRRIHIDGKYKALTSEVSLMLDNCITDLENFGSKLENLIKNSKQIEYEDKYVRLEFNFVINVSNMDNINKELKKIKEKESEMKNS